MVLNWDFAVVKITLIYGTMAIIKYKKKKKK